MNGLPYYKAYPRDFVEGTIGMPFEVKCAYRVVIDLIYMQGGQLPDDPRYISGHLGCSLRKWKSIRFDLIERGKLIVSGEFLTNKRAEKELETLAKLQDKQAENARGPRKIKDLEKPPLNHTEPEPDTDPSSNEEDGDAVDFAKVLFDRGVAFLGRHAVPERQARSLVGKWRKASGDQAVFDAFSACNKAGVTDPVSWIERRLQPVASNTISLMDILKEGNQ